MRFRSLPCLLLPAVLVGCAGISGEPGDAEVATTTSAVVVVERVTGASGGSRAESSARFVRVASSASLPDALRAIGAALALPQRGACALADVMATSADAPPVVELVDVGGVSVRADAGEMRLLPRQLPDVTDVVSGVVYDRAAEPALLPAATPYVVRVAGGGVLAPFEVSAAAPLELQDLRVDPEAEGGALTVTGPSVDFTWAAGAPEDLVYVDIRPNGVRCVFGDVGRASISSQLFDDTGTVIVHRLHREALRTASIDSGEIRFDFARSLTYARH
ncbi:MAG: hypothetical protein JOZ69_10820 [Myxococcales bacterium]|nr:hypothetical protein [Myxococcales bacterium]